ncbi:restriction endonuclease subunit S [Mycoplana ramosa]|uniref:Restriction endonuclease subunit S n=1 Tax=Mycoplana ramosa TaxID=40837 RepID=A0ABW3YY09_MYCRA
MRLKHGCSIYGDYGLNISADEYVDSGVPLIRTSDFDDFGRLHLINPKMVDEDAAKEKMLRIGDILFSRAGTIGRCTVFEREEPATFAAYLVRFRPNRLKVEPRYIHWWAQSSQYWSQIRSDTIESTIGNFNANKLGNLKLPNIDLKTQKVIADFLGHETARIDQLIEKRAKFAELVFERRLAITSRAVTGIADDTPWLKVVPDGWRAERAKVHFRESQQRSETGEEELLTVSHITGVTKRSEKDVNMFMAESNEGYKLVAPGDLIINTMWAWMGAMGVSSEHGLISPSYGVYSPISVELRPAFVDMMVRSKPFVAEATRRSKGIHSSRLRLYPDAFLDMRLPIPPIETQLALLQEISLRTQREDELLRKNERATSLLREFRSALITAAVTGEIDVATWGKKGQTDRRLDQIEEAMRA